MAAGGGRGVPRDQSAEARAGARALHRRSAAAVARDHRISRRGLSGAAAAPGRRDRTRRRCAPSRRVIVWDLTPLNNLVALNYLKGPLEHSGNRRLVPPLGDAGLRRARSADPARPLRVRRPCDARRSSAWCAVINARRFKVDVAKYPKISGVDAACQKLPAFDKAREDRFRRRIKRYGYRAWLSLPSRRKRSELPSRRSRCSNETRMSRRPLPG